MSPPPTITVAPLAAASMLASRRDLEPVAKAGNSKTPAGLRGECQDGQRIIEHTESYDLPIPEDRLRLEDGLLEDLIALRAHIEAEPPVRDALLVSCSRGLWGEDIHQRRPDNALALAYLCVLGELVGGHVIDGEHQLDVVLLGFCDELLDFVRAGLVEEGGADLMRMNENVQLSDPVQEAISKLTETSWRTFLKVKAMPPQMMRELTLSRRLSTS